MGKLRSKFSKSVSSRRLNNLTVLASVSPLLPLNNCLAKLVNLLLNVRILRCLSRIVQAAAE